MIDQSGHVVGIAVARLDEGENVNFAIETLHLVRLLNEHDVTFDQVGEDPTAARPVEEVALKAARFTAPILCLG